MAWSDEMTLILRTTVADFVTPQVYTDGQLQTMLLVGALSLQSEIRFRVFYEALIEANTLTPDPTIPIAPATTRDEIFMNLCCLKSAVLLVTGEIRGYVRQGVAIRDGQSEIRLQRDPRGLQAMIDVYKMQYDEALYAYKTGGSDGLGEIITSPYPYLSWCDQGPWCDGGRGYRSDGFAGGECFAGGGGGWSGGPY
jgi:hypothetical protein